MTARPELALVAGDGPRAGADAEAALVLQRLMRGAFGRGRRFAFDQAAEILDVRERQLRAIADGEQRPGLGLGLAIAGLIGPAAVNALLAVVGYGAARPVEDGTGPCPFRTLAGINRAAAILAEALEDCRIDHVERVGCAAALRELARQAHGLADQLEQRKT